MSMTCKVVLGDVYFMYLFTRSLKHSVNVEGICFIQALGFMNAFCLQLSESTPSTGTDYLTVQLSNNPFLSVTTEH